MGYVYLLLLRRGEGIGREGRGGEQSGGDCCGVQKSLK